MRALSLYVTKMVSRVASNHQLQSALFFGSSANIPISNGSGSAETESLKEVAQKVTTHHPALQPAPQSEEYSTDPEDINIGKTQSWIM